MKVSEVRIKLVNDSQDRLKAFCSITLDDCFVIRDMKVIDGANGLFVAMPSRKLTDHCPKCHGKNHFRAHYCNDCGERLDDRRAEKRNRHPKYHADIAHPINHDCRHMIQNAIQRAYDEELEKSKLPGYKPLEMDDLEDYGHDAYDIPLNYTQIQSPSSRSTDKAGSGFSDGLL